MTGANSLRRRVTGNLASWTFCECTLDQYPITGGNWWRLKLGPRPGPSTKVTSNNHKTYAGPIKCILSVAASHPNLQFQNSPRDQKGVHQIHLLRDMQ